MRQSELIRDYLLQGLPLTAIEALNMFGCYRLAARVLELKKQGYPIERDTMKTSGGAHVARYFMVHN